MTEPIPLGGTLQFRIWVTRGCLFVTSDRLRRKGQYSVVAITILSFYVFILSMIALIFASDMPRFDEIALSSVSIVLSVLIIIVTLLENSREYPLNAEYAFQTAHKLEDLYNRYEAFLQNRAIGDEMQFRDEYNQILRNARVGRKAIDYHQFQLQNDASFNLSTSSRLRTAAFCMFEGVVEYWFYATMAFGPLVAISVYVAKRLG